MVGEVRLTALNDGMLEAAIDWLIGVGFDVDGGQEIETSNRIIDVTASDRLLRVRAGDLDAVKRAVASPDVESILHAPHPRLLRKRPNASRVASET
jgi:hypothetical protein